MKHRVTYERDADGWIATVDGVPGCHTRGRTLAQARERIRVALAFALGLSVREAAAAALVDDVLLPSAILRRAIDASLAARQRAAEAEERARRLTKEVVDGLTAAGISLRDAADLLGLSHQRVQQVSVGGVTRGLGPKKPSKARLRLTEKFQKLIAGAKGRR